MAFALPFATYTSLLAALAIVCISVIAKFLYRVVISWRRSKLLAKSFDGPSKHWLYGSVEHLTSTDAKFAAKYPLGYLTWMGPVNTLPTMTHPDSVKSVLGIDRKGSVYLVLKRMTGNGLLQAEGALWRRRRHLVTPAFHVNVLKPYVKIYNDRCQKTIDVLLAQNAEPIDICDVANKLSLEIILQCAFSYDYNIQGDSFQEDGYLKAILESKFQMLYRLERPYLHNLYIYSWTSASKKYAAACDILHQIANEIIVSRRKEKEDKREAIKKRNYLDFLDLMLEAKDENGKGMEDLEIQDEVASFMFAGHDTTASALGWTLYLLASHQDKLKKCQEEVDAVVRDKKDVEWSDLSRLTYLTMCIKESLRQRPPVSFITRTITKDTEIVPGKIIPAFNEVGINIYLLHHHPDIWNEPEKFDPTRFTAENSKKRPPYTYLPFSTGPKNCIGQQLAMHELKVLLAQIIRNFNLSVLDGHPVVMKVAITLTAAHGIKLIFKRRHL